MILTVAYISTHVGSTPTPPRSFSLQSHATKLLTPYRIWSCSLFVFDSMFNTQVRVVIIWYDGVNWSPSDWPYSSWCFCLMSSSHDIEGITRTYQHIASSYHSLSMRESLQTFSFSLSTTGTSVCGFSISLSSASLSIRCIQSWRWLSVPSWCATR